MTAALITALASASSLFLVAVGLSLIFGVTRIVHFAHGSFYLLGAYFAVALAPVTGFWGAVLGAVFACGLLGIALERGLLRQFYGTPPLYPLLATFGVVLIVQDIALFAFGAEPLLGPRPPELRGRVDFFDARVSRLDLFLIVAAFAVFLLLHGGLRLSRVGMQLRAAVADRQMLAALGVSSHRLVMVAVGVGSALAGLGGALQLPKGEAHLQMDLQMIADVFVVTVVGGLGSLLGAYLVALLIGLLRTATALFGQLQLGHLALWQFELALIFLLMALVLTLRPQGLFGDRSTEQEPPHQAHPVRNGSLAAALAFAAVLFLATTGGPYGLHLATEALCFALLSASVHLLIGWSGIVTFGQAAYFGLGAYGLALATLQGWPFPLALLTGVTVATVAAAVFGGLCLRRSGVYGAMLTLACAQFVYAIAFQWVAVTGGDNGLSGIRPPPWLDPPALFALVLVLNGLVFLGLRQLRASPWGYALQARRDQADRAAAAGLPVFALGWTAFLLAGAIAGLGGALLTLLKGNLSPEMLAIPLSVDALVMALLGGIHHLGGAWLGAVGFTLLKAELLSHSDHWRLVLGGFIVALSLWAARR